MPVNSRSAGSDIPPQLPMAVDTYHREGGVISGHNELNQVIGGTHTGPVDFQTMEGFDTPGFHKRRNDGELLPHTPWNQFKLITESGPSGRENQISHWNGTYYSTRIRDTYFNKYGEINRWFYTKEEFQAIADDYDPSDLVQAVAAKVNSRGHDSLTFIAELHKVRRLFKSTLKKILRLDFPKNFKSASKQWLELRYGWRTLIFDLIELEEAVVSLSNEARSRVSDRVGRSETWVNYQVVDFVHPTNGVVTNHTLRETWDVSLRGSITADFDQTAFHFNAVTTAWELVPWSFVVDWVINIGQVLSALSFLTFTGQYSASSGMFLTCRLEIENGTGTRTSSGPWTYPGVPWSYNSVTSHALKLRTPSPVSKLPQFQLNLDEWKIIDLIALFINKNGWK